MFGKKVFAAMLATVLGASLFGANAAKAEINLDTDEGGLVFAKETLLTASTIPGTGDNKGKTYFQVNGDTDALTVTTASKIGWTQNSSVRVKYELTGMVFSSQISAEDLGGAGTATKLGGGDPGGSTVTFGVGTTALSSGMIVTLDLGGDDDAIGLWVGGSGIGSGSVEVTIENVTFDVEHTADYKGAIKTASGFKETRDPMTVTAEVKEGFREFSGTGSSNNNLTATIGTFMVDFDGDTVMQSDGMPVSDLNGLVDSTSTDKDITFGGDFSFVKMAHLRETDCTATADQVALTLEKDDDDNVTGVEGGARKAPRSSLCESSEGDGPKRPIGDHCSVNGTPTGKPSAQTLPPEIERRDRTRKCCSFRASRASRVAPDSGKAPETREKTRPRLLPVEIGQPAWRWGESGANRSRPLDAAIAPRRPPRELAGVRATGLD